ncbi:hypothetical protein [Arthrobacter sp. PsM3]|uniref:hypothetical protein n=1 Tax=Arthrobacter sp. PsM3 TaxID=3030531 RepID=UPI00263B4BCD|nr:hypothetical protein [Arthrobacter sp. PsM3]MDN4643163.1 hypothetical protein [Arthrobacter sp. PsM3]
MTAVSPAGAASALRRAVLLAGILAVLAGFLGMHILSGSHGMHSQEPHPGSASQAAAEHSAASTTAPAHDGHASHNTVLTAPPTAAATPVPVTPASVTVGGTEVPPSCVCPGGCADNSAVHVDCTPSPAGASLSAPPPGTTPLAMQSWTPALAARPPGRSYHPGTPTPRDLSISRT